MNGVPPEATDPRSERGTVSAALQDWDRDTLLRDGSVARIRPINRDDGPAWRSFYSGLSERTVYLRFMSGHGRPSDAEVKYFVDVDHGSRMAFVIEQHGAIVGIGRYDVTGVALAEVAFTVADEYQGQGVATLLLEYLVAYARQQGIQRFRADTFADNTKMLNVLRRTGFNIQSQSSAGVTSLVFDLTPNLVAQQRVDMREWRASAESVRRILEPQGVAVIGTSLDGSGIGNLVVANIRANGYPGEIAAVNPHAGEHAVIDGVHWCRALGECPFPIDLALVAVAASDVPSVVDDCSTAGVHAMVIISEGFAESGAGGSRLQDEVMARAHRAGIRVIGPNCMGVLNTDPAVSLNAAFPKGGLEPGHVAVASQSVAVGIALLDRAHRLDLSVSSFVSLGNKADVAGTDLLRFWHQDPSTRVILLYEESLEDPRQFFEIARTVGRSKPIVVVKGGRTTAGARAAASHSASAALSDSAADTLFAQAGVIRVSTLEELLEVGALLDHAPIPSGDRLAIVTNAGGAGVMAADAAEVAGLRVELLPDGIRHRLAQSVAGLASADNPVDLGAEAGGEDYRSALRIMAGSRDVDALVVIFAPVPWCTAEEFVRLVSETAARLHIPVVAVTLGVDPDGHTPVARFAFPETAVRTVAAAVRHGLWRAMEPKPPSVLPGIDTEATRRLVQQVLNGTPDGRGLDSQESEAVLDHYGIRHVPSHYVRTDADAAEAAEQLGFPLRLKPDVAGLVDRAQAAAVILSGASTGGIETTLQHLREQYGHDLRGVVVQPMASPGVELTLGAVRDPKFGPLVKCGIAGVDSRLLGGSGVRLAPLTDHEARELIRSGPWAAVLTGLRDQPPCDAGSLAEAVRRIAQLASEIPEITEVECDPLMASATATVAVDVRIHVEPVPSRAPEGVRTIRRSRRSPPARP